MKRRDFLKVVGLTPFMSCSSNIVFAAAPGFQNTLVLLELSGGNDGINTVIPYADPEYKNLRPKIAIPSDQVLKLNHTTGLHPQMISVMPVWEANEMAIIQGVGYPSHNLSHFRSIDILHTASRSDQVLVDGWLTRFFKEYPTNGSATSGVNIGLDGMGPFAGSTDAIALTNVQQFINLAGGIDETAPTTSNLALQHIFNVEQEIKQAAKAINAKYAFNTVFPENGFGNALKAVAQIIASNAGVAAVRLSLGGFDTHAGQLAAHADLLKRLSDGLAAFRQAMIEIGKWQSTLVMTYAEFGRRPKENASGGTDHGTVNSHFMLGGQVKGGLYGEPPQLATLGGSNNNLIHAVDFRSLYGTIIQKWWGKDSYKTLGNNFPVLDVIKA